MRHQRTKISTKDHCPNNLKIKYQMEKQTILFNESSIQECVCAEFKVTQDDLLSKKKSGNLIYARPAWAILLYRHVTDHKGMIASLMNRKSHSSSVNMINTANDLLDSNRKFSAHIQNITNKLNSLS